MHTFSIDRLADEIQTFIEQREAEQSAYGIYDLTMTGGEVLDIFEPGDPNLLDVQTRDDDIRNALKLLYKDYQIIRFDREEADVRNWIFRSRMAEIVRLLSKLKQRIIKNSGQIKNHKISNSKRLVHDLKFTVVPRRVPRRNLSIENSLESLQNSSEHD